MKNKALCLIVLKLIKEIQHLINFIEIKVKIKYLVQIKKINSLKKLTYPLMPEKVKLFIPKPESKLKWKKIYKKNLYLLIQENLL
jgi:hypothetical protein